MNIIESSLKNDGLKQKKAADPPNNVVLKKSRIAKFFFFNTLVLYTIGHKDVYGYKYPTTRKFFKKWLPREGGKNNILKSVLQYVWIELIVICDLEVNPYGRQQINRLLAKLPKTCQPSLFDDKDAELMIELHSIFVSRINSLIKAEGALIQGLR